MFELQVITYEAFQAIQTFKAFKNPSSAEDRSLSKIFGARQ
jgi:hypothetical protein